VVVRVQTREEVDRWDPHASEAVVVGLVEDSPLRMPVGDDLDPLPSARLYGSPRIPGASAQNGEPAMAAAPPQVVAKTREERKDRAERERTFA